MKCNGMLVDCTMSMENGYWVATPVISTQRTESHDPKVGYVILLRGVVVIRKVFKSYKDAEKYARQNWQTTCNNFEIRKLTSIQL